jgi:hypothetical protein
MVVYASLFYLKQLAPHHNFFFLYSSWEQKVTFIISGMGLATSDSGSFKYKLS